jgi:hypothetical protein
MYKAVCMHARMCMHAYINVHVRVRTRTEPPVCMYVCVLTYILNALKEIRGRGCMHVCIYIRTYTHPCICKHAYYAFQAYCVFR